MYRLIKISLIICLFSLIIFVQGCSKTIDYSKSTTTWGDVNQKFGELEQQRVNTLEALKNKTSSLNNNKYQFSE